MLQLHRHAPPAERGLVVVRHTIITDPTTRQPGFDLSRRVYITPKTNVTPAILSREYVARVRDFLARQRRRRCDCRVARCDFVA